MDQVLVRIGKVIVVCESSVTVAAVVDKKQAAGSLQLYTVPQIDHSVKAGPEHVARTRKPRVV